MQKLQIFFTEISDMTNLAQNKKAKRIDNKISDSKNFINTQDFNRLIKINFDARIREAEKDLASKAEVDNALNHKLS